MKLSIQNYSCKENNCWWKPPPLGLRTGSLRVEENFLFSLWSGTRMTSRFALLITICWTVNYQLKNWSHQSNCKWYNEVTDRGIFPICCNFGLLKCGKSTFSFSPKPIKLPFLFASGTKAGHFELQSRTVTAILHLFTFLQWTHLLQQENYLPINPPPNFALPRTFTHPLQQREAEAKSTPTTQCRQGKK